MARTGFPPDMAAFADDGSAYGGPFLPSTLPPPFGFPTPPLIFQELCPVSGGGGYPLEYSFFLENSVDLSSPESGMAAAGRWPATSLEDPTPLSEIEAAGFGSSGDPGEYLLQILSRTRKLEELGHFSDTKNCEDTFENHDEQHKRTEEAQVDYVSSRSSRFLHEFKASDSKNNENYTPGSGLQDRMRIHSIDPSDIPVQPISSRTDPTDIFSEDSFPSDCLEQDIEEPKNRKRKKNTDKEMVVDMKNFLQQVMEQQERMQKQLMEMMEKMENDRVAREEARRNQQEAAARSEMEQRIQERSLAASRDRALISIVEKISGQKIRIPKPEDMKLDVKYHTFDPNNKRWPKSEVEALIRLRGAMEDKFRGTSSKSKLWEDLSSTFADMGYKRSAKKCKEKWENINRYFRKAVARNKKLPENSKACPYFHELEILYRQGVLNPSSPPENVDGEVKEKPVSEQESESRNEEAVDSAAASSCTSGKASSLGENLKVVKVEGNSPDLPNDIDLSLP